MTNPSWQPALPYPRLRLVPRARRPALADFRARWQRPRVPVVLEGTTEDWPARRWTPASLGAAHPAHEITAYVLRDGRIQLDPRTGFRVERMPLSRYVEATVSAGGEVRWYLRCGLDALPPSLAAEVGPMRYADATRGLRRNLWFAAAGTITHLHFDLPFNLVAQLHGQKRFVLFAPRERRRLSPHGWLSSTPHLSRVDAERPDFVRHPSLSDAEAWECVLEPGDALFIPPRWWHYARSLATSISVNTWWADPLTYPVMRLSDAYKRVRGLAI